MANCFGDVVDNFKLDTMVRYAGEKKSQKDRALQSSLLISEDSKDEKAVKYVRGLKDWWGNGVSTLCLIYNQTGNTLRWVDDADWFGYIGPTPYPPEIGNGQWASFLHVKKTSVSSGSMAGLVYRGKDGNGRDRDYMLGWSAPWGAYRNKAYCEVGSVGSFQSRLNNGDLYRRVSNAWYEWDANDSNARCSVRATIERGTSPLFTAYVKTEYG